ncbi:MAG: hypothetical protein HYZ14_02295 [Bacteroidetes bacterium]|nr:hypothetical protein [Bacteroidota bacterium]
MINLNEQHSDEGFRNWQRKQRNGRIVAGILVILAGLVYLLYQMEYKIPEWVFTWPTLIIGVSIIAAVKHGLNDWRWIILFLIGSLFLGGYIYPDSVLLQYKIPVVLFLVGIVIIFKPKNNKHQFNRYRMKNLRHGDWSRFDRFKDSAAETDENALNEDYLYVNNVFSGVEKIVISKDFKGGDIKNTFGGCEINLMQADIQKEAILQVTQQFSGVKLMVPPNWIIKSDINCIFAGIEDKRPVVDMSGQGDAKTLVLHGSIFMGGLEIVSY